MEFVFELLKLKYRVSEHPLMTKKCFSSQRILITQCCILQTTAMTGISLPLTYNWRFCQFFRLFPAHYLPKRIKTKLPKILVRSHKGLLQLLLLMPKYNTPFKVRWCTESMKTLHSANFIQFSILQCMLTTNTVASDFVANSYGHVSPGTHLERNHESLCRANEFQFKKLQVLN